MNKTVGSIEDSQYLQRHLKNKGKKIVNYWKITKINFDNIRLHQEPNNKK